VSIRTFCFPFAGGGASVFRSWTRKSRPEITFCPVQLPGREDRICERAFNRMIPLAVSVAENLIPHLEQPFAFFGHSMGAILAFEIARLLKKCGHREPALLIVGACPAPQLPRKAEGIFKLPDDLLIKKLSELHGTPPEALQDVDLMQTVLPAIRADFEVVESYGYKTGERLNCPIIAIGASEDVEIGPHELAAWHLQTKGVFSWSIRSGNHFSILDSPDMVITEILRHVAKRLTSELS
jgi:medium-chain acyl-[acyl-carrier-protein] hydrolase